jgi:hypothetical protein
VPLGGAGNTVQLLRELHDATSGVGRHIEVSLECPRVIPQTPATNVFLVVGVNVALVLFTHCWLLFLAVVGIPQRLADAGSAPAL